MKKIILLISGIFVFAALIPNLLQGGVTNSLNAYFFYVIGFIVQNYFTFILGFIVLIILFFRFVKFDRNYSLKKNYLLSIFQMINIFITAFFLSYIALLFIAFIELNTFSIFINISPKILNIVSDKNTIIRTLKKNNYPPKIIVNDDGKNNVLAKIAGSITGTNSFYGHYILSSIPNFFVLPIKEFSSSILLIDNNLIIVKLNPADLQEISPTISYLLMQKYFSQRKIKSFPKVEIITKEEYQKFRKGQFEEGLVTVNEEIGKYKNQIATAEASIIEDRNIISYDKSLIDKSNSEYKKCLSDGSYSLAYCKNLPVKSGKSRLEKEITDLNIKLASDQDNQKEGEKYYEFYTTLGKQLQMAEGNITQEFGVFTPKDSIKIVFNTTSSSHTIADYLETLTHEYLHYASYSPEGKKLSDSLFSEGITEYFALGIIKDDLNVSINLGYPVYAKIIGQMNKRILESEIADIYFSKDQIGLEKLLDRIYGESFYKNNRILFLSLQYASDKDQLLAIANEIMKKIGGSQLKENDLLSSPL